MFERGPVADVGSGRGYFLEALARRRIEGIGVDISAEAAEESRRLGHSIVMADATEFLADRRNLGGVFASHLIEHMAPSEAHRFIEAAQTSLSPGGLVVIVTPNLGDWRTLTETFWLDLTHVRPYPMRLLRAMLETAGLRVEASGTATGAHGRREIPSILLGRLRFGLDFRRSEVWVKARRP